MRLVAVTRAQPGSKLARSVYTGKQLLVPLLAAGTVISEEFKQGLLAQGIRTIWIEDGVSDGVEALMALSEEAAREALASIQSAFAEAQLAFSAGRALPDHVVSQMKGVATRLAEEIMKAPDVALWLKDLAEADSYTIQHSLDTCVLGLLLGKRLMHKHGWLDYKRDQRHDLIDERLARLGMGLLLHDIGKLQLPQPILHKIDRSAEELEMYRSHPILGAEILKGDHVSALVRAVTRWHHENWDGSGYPHGLEGESINELARICSVANIFDNVTSDRPGQPALPLDLGVERIVMGAGSEFDPRVVEIFKAVVAPYPVGTEVQLSDGKRALVIEVFEENLARPLIRIIETASGDPLPAFDLDLREAPEIAVVGTV